MKQAYRIAAWTVTGLLLTSATLGAVNKVVQTRMHRPVTVGTEVDLTTSVEEEKIEKATVGNRTLQKVGKVRAEVNYRRKTLAVNEKGFSTVIRCVINRFEAEVDGKTVPPLKPGSVVVATAEGGKQRLRLEGGKLSPEQDKALQAALVVAIKLSKTPDEVFRLPQTVGIGVAYEADKDVLLRDAGFTDLPLDPRGISGRVRVQEASPVHGVECVRFLPELKLLIKPGVLPNGVEVLGGALATQGNILAPVEPSQQEIAEEVVREMTVQLKAPGPNGQQALVEIRGVEKSLTVRKKAGGQN